MIQNEYDNDQDIDITHQLEKMTAHQFILTPDNMLLSLTGSDIAFTLEMFQKIQRTMALSLSDTTLTDEEHSEMMYIARHSEDIYNNIIKQLKVSKANINLVN